MEAVREHDQALNRAMQGMLRDNTELFKRFSDDPEFKRWLADMSFTESYSPGGGGEQPELVPS